MWGTVPLAWELPYASSEALKRKKRKKKKKKKKKLPKKELKNRIHSDTLAPGGWKMI